MATFDEAIQHLENGDWDAAHHIVQADSSQLGSWAHGIVHTMEGDLSNARYWYKRAERPLPDPPQIEAEIAALKLAFESAPTSLD